MKQGLFRLATNEEIAPGVFRLVLIGDTKAITAPGQFVNIKIDELFLRRPISVCDLNDDSLTLVYKVVGVGTEKLSQKRFGAELDLLSGLGNGFDLSLSGDAPLLIGGGVGVPPLLYLCKKLKEQGAESSVILGFNTKAEIILKEEFRELSENVIITTVDGSYGVQGFVTDGIKELSKPYSFVYTCGPEPMLKAVYTEILTFGQFSFEERMGCGFGACMGCSCKTITGYKRICKEGPVLMKEEILWD